MAEEKNTSAPESREDRYVDKVTEQRIHEHLADPNSRITEEDIARVNTDIFRRDPSELEMKEDEEKLDEELPPKAGSSWDVMSE